MGDRLVGRDPDGAPRRGDRIDADGRHRADSLQGAGRRPHGTPDGTDRATRRATASASGDASRLQAERPLGGLPDQRDQPAAAEHGRGLPHLDLARAAPARIGAGQRRRGLAQQHAGLVRPGPGDDDRRRGGRVGGVGLQAGPARPRGPRAATPGAAARSRPRARPRRGRLSQRPGPMPAAIPCPSPRRPLTWPPLTRSSATPAPERRPTGSPEASSASTATTMASWGTRTSARPSGPAGHVGHRVLHRHHRAHGGEPRGDASRDHAVAGRPLGQRDRRGHHGAAAARAPGRAGDAGHDVAAPRVDPGHAGAGGVAADGGGDDRPLLRARQGQWHRVTQRSGRGLGGRHRGVGSCVALRYRPVVEPAQEPVEEVDRER